VSMEGEGRQDLRDVQGAKSTTVCVGLS